MKLKKISFAALAIALTGCMWSCGTKSGETVKTDTENPLRDSLEHNAAKKGS